MANEFVARRGIIAQSGGAKITGSLLVSGTIDATGYNIIASSFTGSFSGSIGTATTASYVSPSGLPAGTVSASAQIDYNSIQNKLSGVVSSSTQVQPLLPGGTVSSSAQYPGWVTSSAQVNTGSFTGSFIGSHTGSILAPGVVSSSAQYPGWVTSSTQIVWSSVAYNAGIVSSSGQVQPLLPGGTVSSSAQYPGWVTSSTQIDYNSIQNKLSGVVSSSAQVAPLLPANTVSSSGQVTAFLPTGTVSSSTQFKTLTDPFTGSFTGSFTGDGSGLTGIATVLGVSGSTGTATINLKTQALTINGGNGVTTSATGQSVTVSAPAGTVTASSQIDYNSIQNKLSGVYSSSTQAVAAIAGQNIAPAAINATGAISGASIQVGGNGTVGGNLTVTGTLFATSQSVQYVSSSTLNIATNRIIVNTDSALRFGGISVIDSGSANNSGSLYWDSVNDRWLYEDVSSGNPYNSAIFIAGPQNFGSLGQERGLLTGRVPVASGDDHIDTAAASSSIRVDFPSKLTHIEAGLFITGNLTANGTVTLQGIPSSSTQVQALLPGGTVSSSAQYPGWVTSSAQIVWSSVNYNTGIVSSSTQVQANLPGGTVSSSAQYPGWVTASSQIQLASITGTSFASSNFTFPQGVTVAGLLSASTSAYVTNTLYSGSTVTGIVGPVTNQVVASLATGSFNAAYFDYTINDGTNYRAGTVMSVWNPSTVEYTETSTNDLGNTAQATFVVDVVSGVARLKFSNVSGTWSVKTGVRSI